MQSAVKQNMDLFFLKESQWADLVSGQWVGSLIDTPDELQPLDGEARVVVEMPRPRASHKARGLLRQAVSRADMVG